MEILNRLIGAVIVIGAGIIIAPTLLGIIGNSSIDPVIGFFMFVCVAIMILSGFIYIFREKQYS